VAQPAARAPGGAPAVQRADDNPIAQVPDE